ncbi:hypothetical protein CAPTEDRAFT_147072 [Capitella teleta]|uniref:DNA excision repair protein ERCC-8 n=1 Tax=Capitella teleta TaxID=283909 RepID=R7UK11_CAPTE|nr:hypothetical protein CAPTEDRAFT_147072 [Capitella teleta]|eukprot:ELU06884.1 hypothetical protein CAPTEDRAFT_147072 [Capitella teleta]
MLHLLHQREVGTDRPLALQTAQSSRRAYSLEISKDFDVQKIHTSGITSLDVDSTENRYLLSGSADGIVCVHDMENHNDVPKAEYPCVSTIGRSNRYRHKHSVETVKWYPFDNGMFLTSGTDKVLKVWDANVLKTADEFAFSGVVYSHDMSSLASSRCLVAVSTQSSQIKLIDLKTGSATHSLRGHTKAVYSVQWSSRDEHILASGSADSRVLMWDVRMAKGSLFILDQHNGETASNASSGINTAHDGKVNAIRFLPDGLHLMTFGTDDRLHLWDASRGRHMNVNYGRIDNASRRSVRLSSSDGCRPPLAYVPTDSNIYVFDIFSGLRTSILRGHYTQVNACYFHADRQELYSGANDRNILIWTPVTDKAFERQLQEKSEDQSAKNFTSRTAATADAWSSDSD